MTRLTHVGWLLSLTFVAGCSAEASPGDEGSGGTASGGQGQSKGGTTAMSSGGSAGTSSSSGGSNAGSAGAAGTVSAAGSSSGSGGSSGSSGGGGSGSGGTSVGPITGDPGVWENVTPVGIDLVSNFGVANILADPLTSGVFYAFTNLEGADGTAVWMSEDWGTSWSPRSTDGNLEKGKPWGSAIAQDGSYMLSCNGNFNGGAWKSTDGGVTWTAHSMSNDNDPYTFDIDPANKDHVISSMHNGANIFESTNGGDTWADKGSAGTGGSNYVFFINTTTWLSIAQSGSNTGTRRTTNSGTNWSDVAPAEHAHGNAQIFVDPDNADVYIGGHDNGIYRSTDDGASFTQVSTTRSSGIFGTGTTLYSTDGGANGGGTAPIPQSASRSTPTQWSTFEVPAGMTNGVNEAATVFDADTGHWVVVAGNWNAGIWRYIEP